MPATLGMTNQDRKYSYFKTKLASTDARATSNDLELLWYNKPGSSLTEARRLVWGATVSESTADAEFRFMKAAVGTGGVNENIDDLRFLYYANY